MIRTHTLAPCLYHAAWQRTPVPAVSRLRERLVILLDGIAARRERKRFRWELKRIAKSSPHLIGDIGLTRRQAEAEIAALPFWQR